MKLIIAILISIILSVGCTTLNSVGTITTYINETDKGVTFQTDRPAKMSMKVGETEYTYDSQEESIISKIVSILTLGMLGARR